MEKNIVTVDDSKTITVSIKMLLEQNNYNVFQAGDGESGLKLLDELANKGAKISLIVSDINMPKMNGLDFLKQVKSDERFKFTPVIMLTSEGQVSKMTEAKKLGATGYLIKPFHGDQLIEIVKKFAR